MSLTVTMLLAAAGVGAGLCGSIAGLASLVSFPALLSVGLNPVTANVTNTAALLTTTVGSIAGSGPELQGRWQALRPLALRAGLGGVIGALLVLITPVTLFERLVPVFLFAGATVVLAAGTLRRVGARRLRARSGTHTLSGLAVTGVGVYGGYFAAGAGVLMMAVLSLRDSAPLVVVNAGKNVCSGAANLTASAVYVVAAPIDYSAALPLGAGALLGSWLGPKAMRRLPEAPLRWAIGLTGYWLAFHLF